MADSKRFKVDNGGIHFPEPIIHHIQSFLDAKQAALTSLVSKSWYDAWLTSPNVLLDDQYFSKFRGERLSTPQVAAFWKFAIKTVQRYLQLNLQIDKFQLWMGRSDSDPFSLSTELIIPIIAEIGVKEIDLSVSSPRIFRDMQVHPRRTLPLQVLEAETLVRLSLRGWSIERPPNGMVNHSRLKSLTLELMYISGDCFSLIFPCLEDLTLKNCSATGRLQISSTSLKYLCLESVEELKAKFNVPSIRKFRYSSFFPDILPVVSFPVLTFSTVSEEMECVISLQFRGLVHGIAKKRFYELRRFMKNLSGSKVSLVIRDDGCCAYDKELKGKQGPLVDNLALSLSIAPSNYHYFLAGIFWSCPPKFMTLSWFPNSCIDAWGKASSEFVIFLCKELIRDHNRCPTMDPVMKWKINLAEVKLEHFDTSLATWQPFPWEILLSPSMSPKTEEKLRFCLKWHEKAPSLRRATRSTRMLVNKELPLHQTMKPPVRSIDH